jgi:phenylalanyl-tRNA synthetase beta chain
MNTSLAWLRDFVPTRTPAVVLGEKFRMTSSELEGVIDWKERLEHCVIGHILTVEQHPNADRLKVTTVDIGSDKPAHIVCGAPNVAVGQYVVVATPGAVMQPTGKEPFTINLSTIRGEKSEGMLCGLEELGLATHSEGLHVFEGDPKPGTAAAKVLVENDEIMDLEITPNRPDLLSHYGLAREVAAFEGLKLTPPQLANIDSHRTNSVQVKLHLPAHKECLRYTGIVLSVEVKPSPWWMQSRLIRSGIRPINSVVDVTNYVMLELGQPMHAFDLDQIPQQNGEHVLTIRQARDGETLALLDESTRTLAKDDIIIADASDKAIDLAGIMGGAGSGISEKTTRVLLESACFNPSNIRRTSRRLGLRSEASSRFEKGVDCELADKALKRAIFLLQEIADAKLLSKLIDNRAHPVVRPHIHVSFEQITRILGVRISAGDCKEILNHLGFELKEFTKSGFTVTPPTWRRDVTQLEDIVEELVRIWGYERLPYTLPTGFVKAPQENVSVMSKRTIRHALAAASYHETLHQTLTSETAIQRCGIDIKAALPLKNPLSGETAYLSPSHLVSLLADCGSINADKEELNLFEIGKIFSLPHIEHEQLTMLVRTSKGAEHAIRTLKAGLDRVINVLSLAALTYIKTEDQPYSEKGLTLGIYTNEVMVGTLSLISTKVVTNQKIRRGRDLVAAEVNLDILLAQPRIPLRYQLPPVYPVSERDITVTVEKSTPLETLATTVEKALNRDLVRSWQVLDIYSGKPLSDTHQSVTFRIIYNAADRTLSDDEMKAHHTKLEEALKPFRQQS